MPIKYWKIVKVKNKKNAIVIEKICPSTRFFISNSYIGNTRRKLTNSQAIAQLHPEALRYHPKNNRVYSEKMYKNKHVSV